MTENLTAVPLIGRLNAVNAVLDRLLDPVGPGVLIHGDAGIGKTSLANAVVAGLAAQVRPYRVHATAALSRMPHAALAPLLTALDPGQIDDPRSVLMALKAELRPALRDDPTRAVLVIEDAHYLDTSSAAVIAQLAAAGNARVMVLCRPHPALLPELHAMWTVGLLHCLELHRLSPQEVNELCFHVLGAPLIPSAGAVLARLSSGNPMFLLELIAQAREAGQLVRRNEYWVLLGEPGAATPRLTDLVRHQITDLSPGQREALEAVALAEAIPRDVLQRASNSGVIDQLTELRFITTSADPSRHVRLTQPLIGEVIRQLIPAARRMVMRRRIVELMDSKPEALDGSLRHVTWALESGADVSDIEILAATELANRLFIPKYAARVVGLITDPSLLPAANVARARAQLHGGDLPGAKTTLEGVVHTAKNLRTVRQATMLGVQLAGSHANAADNILRAANDWVEAATRLAGSDQSIDANEIDEARLGSRLVALQAMQTSGCHAETEAELRRIWDLAQDDENRLLSGTLLAETLTVLGRPVSALQILLAVQDILASCGDYRLEFAELVMRRYLSALLYAGELAVLDEYVQRHIDLAASSLIYLGGLLHFAAGSADLRRGAAAAALPKLSQAAEVLRFVDIGRDLPDTVAATAYAASMLGREDLAVAKADQFDELEAGTACPSLPGRAHAVAARAALRGSASTVSSLMCLADEARESGALMFEVEILSTVLRLGEDSVVDRLALSASRCEGRSAESTAAFCRALAMKDADALTTISKEAAHDGMDFLAAECADQALRISSNRGDETRQFNAEKLVTYRTAALDRRGDLAADGSIGIHRLTRREREIAALAQSGATNRDISVRLGLSIRTVEGHLYRMFAKLGISHRADLAAAAYGSPAAAAIPS